jgi:DNA-binding beta-propeller fold protein YncE
VTAAVVDPFSLAINPVSKKVYSGYGAGIEVLSAVNDKLITSIPSAKTFGIAVDPITNTIYGTVRRGHNGLQVIDGKTNTITGVIKTGGGQMGVAVDQRTDTIFVTDHGELAEVNGKTGKVTATAIVPAIPLAVDTLTKDIFVARYGSPNVLVYHSASG